MQTESNATTPDTATELLAAAGLLLDAPGVKARTAAQGGGWSLNHAEAGIPVRTSVTGGPGSGGVWLNHSEAGIPVRTAAQGGGWQLNHAEAGVPNR